jgi:hypothetical protein
VLKAVAIFVIVRSDYYLLTIEPERKQQVFNTCENHFILSETFILKNINE